jgi:peptide/nickel transport system permease protein
MSQQDVSLGAIPTVILLSMVVFFVLRALPADPLALLLPPNATNSRYRGWCVMRSGSYRSIGVQYLIWLRDALAGNLGPRSRSASR